MTERAFVTHSTLVPASNPRDSADDLVTGTVIVEPSSNVTVTVADTMPAASTAETVPGQTLLADSLGVEPGILNVVASGGTVTTAGEPTVRSSAEIH